VNALKKSNVAIEIAPMDGKHSISGLYKNIASDYRTSLLDLLQIKGIKIKIQGEV
jgi:hypothetical protein